MASARPGASRSRTTLVPSGVWSRGPNPVPPVVTISPAKPSASSTTASPTFWMPSATTRRSTTSKPAPVSSSARAAPLLSSRVPSITPSDTVSTFACRPDASWSGIVLPQSLAGLDPGTLGPLARPHRGLALGLDDVEAEGALPRAHLDRQLQVDDPRLELTGQGVAGQDL